MYISRIKVSTTSISFQRMPVMSCPHTSRHRRFLFESVMSNHLYFCSSMKLVPAVLGDGVNQPLVPIAPTTLNYDRAPIVSGPARLKGDGVFAFQRHCSMQFALNQRTHQ